MKNSLFQLRLVRVVMLALILTSCGGGGGDDGLRAPVSELFIVNIPSEDSDNRIVYLAEQDKPFVRELYLVNIANPTISTKLNVIPVGSGVTRFAMSRDGAKIAYTADVDRIPSDATVIGPVGPERQVMVAHFSPDGTQVAYTASDASFGNTELFLAHLASPTISTKLNGPLTLGGAVGTAAFKFSPDGAQVVYGANQDTVDDRTFGTFELYLVDLAQPGVSTKINAPLVAGGNIGDSFESLFDFTSDGSKVVYRADQDRDEMYELYVVDLANPGVSNKVNGLLASSESDIRAFALSPDGTKVVYTADQDTEDTTELYVVDLANPGVSEKLNPTLDSFGTVALFEISLDGAQVFYNASQNAAGPFELYVVEIATPGVAIKLTPPFDSNIVGVERFSVNSDSSQVAYTVNTFPLSSAVELYFVNVEEPGIAIDLSTISTTGRSVSGEPQFSLDHTHVAFLAFAPESNTGTELFAVNLAQPGASIKLNGPLVSGGFVISEEFEANFMFVPYRP